MMGRLKRKNFLPEREILEVQKHMDGKTVRTRFAPSPTGYMHIGNLRTALFTLSLIHI